MDICVAAAKDVSYLIVNHPMYSAFGSLILLISLMRFYCRLTLGICECDEDMTGKTVLITGASSGIGKATAMDLARRNARVLMACRNIGKASKVAEGIKSATGNQNVIVKCLDLCSFESVRKCAQNVLETEDKLHVLINNAGISGMTKHAEFTEDGCEKVMQSNHFGHFLFTLLLHDLLKRSAPSRIINVSSAAHKFAKLNLEDLNDKNAFHLSVYANSKLANVLFTTELAQRLSDTGVTANALHPGCVSTDLIQGAKGFIPIMTKLVFLLLGKTPEEGAQTTIYLAVHPEVAQTTGKYFSDCKEEPLKEKLIDRTMAKRLFAISETIVGASFSKT